MTLIYEQRKQRPPDDRCVPEGLIVNSLNDTIASMPWVHLGEKALMPGMKDVYESAKYVLDERQRLWMRAHPRSAQTWWLAKFPFMNPVRRLWIRRRLLRDGQVFRP